ERLRDARYVADPWQGPVQFRPGETILIAGSGLTMADVVLAGQDAAQGLATVHAISRHGLLPASQDEPRAAHTGEFSLGAGVSVPSARRLLRAVRELTREGGRDWRAVLTAVRAAAPGLWQGLSVNERRRFLRHVRTYWDVHRHRLPPESERALGELRRN